MRIKPETKELVKTILEVALAGAVIPLALLAPNAVGPIARVLRTRKIPRERARVVINYLKRHGLVILRESGNDIVVSITERGRRRLYTYNFEHLRIEAPQRWDGKWRLVAFDVPEEKRNARDALRDKLKGLGFLKLQQSLWAHPYPCENEINLIGEVFQVSPYLWLVEAAKIDHEDYLLKKFKLRTRAEA